MGKQSARRAACPAAGGIRSRAAEACPSVYFLTVTNRFATASQSITL